jgi:hypothetical protein
MHALRCGVQLLFSLTSYPQAAPGADVRQPLDDAWWTGPILAASGATLPRGHYLIEPYFLRRRLDLIRTVWVRRVTCFTDWQTD